MYSKPSQEILSLTPDEKGFFANCVPKKYQDAELDNLDLQPKEFIAFGKNWALNPGLLVLTGGYGTGKTRFAFALIREVFRKCPKRIWPRYYTSMSLDNKLKKASMSDEGDEYELKATSEEDLLFIDDLGRETKSDRLKRQYFEIFNARDNNLMPTIVTTNKSLDELFDLLEPAIASRMQEWDLVEFNGIDLRSHVKKAI